MLCRAVYRRPATPADYLGGSEAAMLFDAAKEIRVLRTALLGIGADIAKAGCCDHAPGQSENPNRCTRDHLMVKFLERKRRVLA